MSSLRERLARWWVVRSLGAGIVGTVLDHSVGVVCAMAGVPTRWAAMSGKVVGFTFGFFALRHFAFVDHRTSLLGSAVRFAAINFCISLLHGQVTVWLREGAGAPYVVAAMTADLLVVTPLSLLANRYAIFPKHRERAPPPKV
jgi:putative flippase GtrA